MTWKGVCFDLDNTLFDHEKAFEKSIHYCYCTLMQKSKSTTIPFEMFFSEFKKNCDRYWSLLERGVLTKRDYQRKRFNETVVKLNLRRGNELSDEFHKLYYQVVDDFSEPYPGLKRLLTFLTNHQIKIGIITNGKADVQLEKIQQIGAGPWIDKKHIVISDEVGCEKPDTLIFKDAEKRLDLSSENLIYVGDSWKHDVMGAIDAGWSAIFLNTRGEKRATMHEPVSEYYTLEQVTDYFMDLYGPGGGLRG